MRRRPLDPREREIREQIRFYLEERARELEAQGVPCAEARKRALAAFGDVEKVVADALGRPGGREPWHTLRLAPRVLIQAARGALRDSRHAARSLARSPGFASAALLTLAVGIGACSSVFALVDNILLRPLPYPDAERLVVLSHAAPGLGLAEAGQSEGTYLHYRAHNRVFEEVGTWYENVVNLAGDGDAERVPVAMVSQTLFSVLGARAALGRLPTSDDASPNADEVSVLLSHERDPHRRGRAPVQRLRDPRPLVSTLGAGALGDSSADGDLTALIASVRATVREADPDLPIFDTRTQDALAAERLATERRLALASTLGGALALLLTCVALYCTVSWRVARRTREIGIRIALGARSARVLTSVVGETLALVALGLVVGAFAARASAGLVARQLFGVEPGATSVQLSAALVLFTVGVAAAYVPAWRAARVDPMCALRTES